MSILVLKSDPTQVEPIRHIVCNVIGTELTLVDSIDDALEALRVTTPDLVLLPALVSPSDETKLVAFLHEHPKAAHVETLFTPVIGQKEKKMESRIRGWLRWLSGPRESDEASIDETTLFAERLTLALHAARERRRQDEELRAAVAAEEPVAEAASHEDRRLHRRIPAQELMALHSSRVAGGPRVNVRDVSAGGVLFESATALENDFGVLELITGMLHRQYLPFRVVRRQVETQDSQTQHVEACVFLEPLDVSGLQPQEASTASSSALAPIDLHRPGVFSTSSLEFRLRRDSFEVLRTHERGQ